VTRPASNERWGTRSSVGREPGANDGDVSESTGDRCFGADLLGQGEDAVRSNGEKKLGHKA